MRLYVDVREGDWSEVDHGPYGARVSWALDKLIGAADFDAAAGTGRWLDLHRRSSEKAFEISVPDTDAAVMTVGELKAHCLAEARRSGAAGPEQVPTSEASRPEVHGLFQDRITDIWLSDPATDERLSEHLTLARTDLTDGDLLVLSIKHTDAGSYLMAGPPNPAELLRWLQVAENATAPAGGPRLWGVLLYTDADVELATYVRTHFDDLNVLSGPATRVFVVERRATWATAKQYWRRHLEPELYRVMSAMHWLRWTPYDPQGAYEIASLLGLGPELLPCLVFFHSPEGPLHEGEKIVFPIEHTSTAYLRSLFGAIDRGLGPVAASVRSPQADRARRWLERYGPTSDYYGAFAAEEETRQYAPAPDAIRNLLAPGRAADAAAFAAVRAAEAAIKAALRPLVPSPPGLTVHNSHVVVSGTTGAEVSENFYFQGENTTFINRPQDTVIRDFQNTYAAAPGADDLARLLQLVLSSRDVAAPDREAAAAAIHEVARIGAAPEPDLPAVRTRVERLRELLAASADIAQPALAILASLTAYFSA
ncbi:hypothetical protein [Streptomyces sp. NPDC006368]|uniref:hypothetical protein n=1 Tax=Streptomyces sp. NPDC006368 TaxID=3156760 RepID=UPI0033AE3281